MTDSNIKEFNSKVEHLLKLREDKQELKQKATELQNKIDIEEREIINILDALEMSKYTHPLATISITEKTSVKVPKDEENRKLFFDWLKDEGVFENVITVHSSTLNSMYKERLEQAMSKGEADVEIPGLKDISSYQRLSIRGS